MTKSKKWTIGLLSFVASVALAIYLFDWNLLRGFVERRVTAATGRSFSIKGDLDVKLSWHPKIILNDVAMGNAAWSQTPQMAALQRAEVVLDLGSIFGNEVSLPVVHLTKPDLVLEKNQMGIGNWVFDQDANRDQKNSKTVRVRDLQIESGKVVYRSPVEQADVEVLVASTDDTAGNTRLLRVDAKGTYHDLETNAHGEVGAINALDDLQRAYPLQLSGQVGKTRMRADGTVNKPLQLDGINLQFELSGDSLADLFPLIGVPLPATPAYSIAGQLNQSGALWDLENFSGKIGNSDLHGQFSVNRGQQPQFIKANLQSNNLDLKDLSGFIGARTESGKTIVDPNRVLPSAPFSFDKLYAANADVQFKGKRIKTQRLPIDDMSTHLLLTDGRLTLDPLNFGVASGDISSTINLNARVSPIETDADIKIKNLRFDQLFPDFKFEKANAGIVGGRAKFVSKGDSIAAMLGSANGQMAFMMNGGSVSTLAVRLANLDVANSLAVLLGGDKSAQIRCMVTDLSAQDGNMQVKTMVLDTEKSVINGQGNLNFKDESLNLRLVSDPKDISLIALRGPIEVKGTFKNPSARPALKNVSGRVVAAAALGAISGPLAFIPLIDFGGGEDSNCAKLLRDADQHSKETPKPVTAAAGKALPKTAKLMNYGVERGNHYFSVSF